MSETRAKAIERILGGLSVTAWERTLMGKAFDAGAAWAMATPGRPETEQGGAARQIDALASVLLAEFGGPEGNESAADMAVRVLRAQAETGRALAAALELAGRDELGEADWTAVDRALGAARLQGWRK